jgi:hypothetical protein
MLELMNGHVEIYAFLRGDSSERLPSARVGLLKGVDRDRLGIIGRRRRGHHDLRN